MPRNKLAGRSTGKSASAKYYASNPSAREKKKEYDTKFSSKPAQVKKRVEANAYNAKHGKKGDGLDASHRNGKVVKLEKASANRARHGNNSTTPKKKKTK
jgi:hypothetical protein